MRATITLMPGPWTSWKPRGRVLFRYCDAGGEVTPEANPNGAANNIAGIVNEQGNVLGMMPHPERSCEELLGSADGNLILQSIADSCVAS